MKLRPRLHPIPRLSYTQSEMPEQKDLIKVEISHKTVIFTVAFLIALWFLVQIKQILILVFLSIILLSALLKPVEWLSARRVPRLLSVLVVYLVVIALMSVAVGIIVPPLVSQTIALSSRLPETIAQVNDFFIFNQIPVENLSVVIGRQVQQLTGDIVRVTTAIFSSVFLLLTIFVMSFYLLLDWKKFVLLMASPFSGKQEKKVITLIAKVENGLGRWVRGQLSLSLIVGAMVFLGLTVLGVPYALPLALVAAILEIIPVIGPIVASIPAILVGLTISPLIALATAALFIIVQQLENNIIVPIIMSKVAGLQPPVLMVALLIGAKIAGLGGAFLAVPFLIVAKIVIKELFTEDSKIDADLSET